MEEQGTWRELLGQLLKKPQEKERVANTVGVTAVTLSRWIRHESSPRPYHLQALFKAFPEYQTQFATSFAQEFEEETWRTETPSDVVQTLSTTFYAHILNVIAHTPQPLRFWSVCSSVIQQCLSLFDSHHVDMAVLIAGCTLPDSPDAPVRSLHGYAGQGTGRREGDLRQKAVYLLGAESLCGHAVATGRLVSIDDYEQVERMPVGVPIEGVRSAVATPLLREDRIGGVLYLFSTQPHAFSVEQLSLIQQCADLVALAFEADAFFAPESIKLAWFPEQRQQQPCFATFQQRVARVLYESRIKQEQISYDEAEQRVWQQIEAQLIDIIYHEMAM